ncbi:hypothetical protein NI17_017060 [Thermobifida halotolerans]|uniref:Uncharacterized protein n=1 Tax=Thermobifida halotolerans TaxID=483545 RepID=A0AA97LUX1_9ACTN|nr:hypothetical protein [Thermobifida halotolerans]UOE18519.1 hypothetical protein NI17_017060 [Thermobifida halotolerans]
MVFSDRGRRDLPGPAVRRSVSPALARVLVIGGLVTAGWLCAGVGEAFADDAFPNERDAVATTAEEVPVVATATAALSRDGGASLPPAGRADPPVGGAPEILGRVAEPPGDGPRSATVPALVAHVRAEVDRIVAADAAPADRGPAPDAAAAPRQDRPPSTEETAPAATETVPLSLDGHPGTDDTAPTRGTPVAPVGTDAPAPAEAENTPVTPAESSLGVPDRDTDDSAAGSSPSQPNPAAGYLTQRIESPSPAAVRTGRSGGPVSRVGDVVDTPSSSPD